MRPVHELRSAVEGDRATGAEGEGTQRFGDLRHDGLCPFLRVAKDHNEPAQALDHRGHIGEAEFLAEVNQVGLPCVDARVDARDILTV